MAAFVLALSTVELFALTFLLTSDNTAGFDSTSLKPNQEFFVNYDKTFQVGMLHNLG